MTTDPHRVLVVEDENETRRHFAAAISSCERFALSAAVGSCAEARAWLKTEAPAVLLTDLQLPDGHGVALIEETRRAHPNTHILVISVFGDERNVIASVRAGASGYLLKDGTADQICRALTELVDGGSPLSPSVARYVLRLVQGQAVAAPPPKGPMPTLTQRELEVLELLGKGFSSSEIAELLKVSRHTVITHSRSIHRKLEVSSRSAAIFEAINLGLIRLRE